jgi:hypothetical protein
MAALDFPTTLRLKEGEWKGGKVGGSERWEKSHVEVPSAASTPREVANAQDPEHSERL